VKRTDTGALKARVARHWSEPEWFTTFELALYGAVETPDGRDRTIDALAINRVTSRGNELVGIEVKSERSDWLRELATPQKAEAWCRVVDRFVVVADKGVVKAEELPVGWGLLVESGTGLAKVAQPAIVNPWRENGGADPVPRELWVRILRRTLDHEHHDPQVAAAYTRGHEAGVKESRESIRSELSNAKGQLQELQEGVAAFSKATGLDLHREVRGEWAGERLGKLVRAATEHKDLLRNAGNDLRNFKRLTDDLEKSLRAAGWKPEEEP